MHNFRTILNQTDSNFKIRHQDRLLFIGSCFSDNIGSILNNQLFNTSINPTGIIYHPSILVHQFDQLINHSDTSESNTTQKDGKYVHYDYHSSITGSTKANLFQNITESLSTLKKSIIEADIVFISLGSAWGFKHKKTDHLVANCHKQDAAIFEKTLSSHNDLVFAYQTIIKNIQSLNPDIHIVFTISPIRHLRYGMIENNIGKSRLISALHDATDGKDCTYFPSYELIIDDLRDYRFYKDDMLHPSNVAVDYIWQYFSNHYFDETTKSINNAITKLQRQLNHRIQSEDHATIKVYVDNLEYKIQQFKQSYPTVNCHIMFEKINSLRNT